MSGTGTSLGARQQLSARLTEGLVTAPGAYDPLTAQIIARIGFPAVYLGGNALAIQLGLPQPLLSRTETVEAAARVLQTIDVPLVVDAGAGFGDAAHTSRTVHELERIGVAAVHLDDQPYPKQFGYHYGNGAVLPQEAMVDKLIAAVEARRDPGFRIIARTDALRVNGDLSEVGRRCLAYLEAGADMLMVLDLSPAQCRTLRSEVGPAQLVWIGGVRDPGPSLEVLADAGFAMAVYPFTSIAATATAVRSVWGPLHERGRLEHPAELTGEALPHVLELVGMSDYRHIESRTVARHDDSEDAR